MQGKFWLNKSVHWPSIQTVDNQYFASLSPNPIYTEGVLQIAEKFGKNVKMNIVNTLGQVVETADLRDEKYIIIRRKHLINGIYFIHLKSESKQTILKMNVISK